MNKQLLQNSPDLSDDMLDSVSGGLGFKWAPAATGAKYKIGDQVSHGGKTYTVREVHTPDEMTMAAFAGRGSYVYLLSDKASGEVWLGELDL